MNLLTGLVVLNGAHGATGDPMLTFVDNGLVIDRPEWVVAGVGLIGRSFRLKN